MVLFVGYFKPFQEEIIPFLWKDISNGQMFCMWQENNLRAQPSLVEESHQPEVQTESAEGFSV